MSYPPPPPGHPPYGQSPYGQPMYGAMPTGHEQRPSPAVLVGLSLWRLVIIAFAFTGFFSAVSHTSFDSAIPALSQQASLLTGIVYVGLLLYPLFVGGARHEPRSPWWRGAMCVLLVLVSGTFLTLMGGSLTGTASLFEHGLTPLIVFIDWILSASSARVKWWHPFSWCLFPLAYLGYYVASDLKIYDFLDSSAGNFAQVVVSFLAGVIAVGFVLLLVGKLRGAATSGTAR